MIKQKELLNIYILNADNRKKKVKVYKSSL